MKKIMISMFAAAIAFAGCSSDKKEVVVPPPSTLGLSLGVAMITTESAQITVEPFDKQAPYVMCVVKAEEVVSDADYAALLVTRLKAEAAAAGGELAGLLLKGDKTELVDGFEDNTAYYLFAVYVNEAGAYGTIAKKAFTTEKIVPPDPADTTFEFDVRINTLFNVDFTITPSNNDVVYVYDVNRKGNFNWPLPLEIIESLLEWWYELYGSVEETLALRGKRGPLARNNTWGLEEDTEYYYWAVGVNPDGSLCTELSVGSVFTTPKFVPGSESVTVDYKYYDGDALYAADPEKYSHTQGRAYTLLTATPTAGAEHWYAGLFSAEGFYDDMGDVRLINVLLGYSSTMKDITTKIYNASWDSDLMFLSVAEGENGQMGSVSRKKVRLTKDGVSPITDLVGDQSNKARTAAGISPVPLSPQPLSAGSY